MNAEARVAASMPDLDRMAQRMVGRGGVAEDVRQIAALELLERGEDWMRHAFDGPADRQWMLLMRLTVRHAATRHWRDVRRARNTTTESMLVRCADSDPEQDCLALETERERMQLLRRGLSQVTHPVYRLVLTAVDLPDDLDLAMFEAANGFRGGGARTFVRPWQEAAQLVLETTLGDRRRFVALAIRTSLVPTTTLSSPEVAIAAGWMDRNLSRARAAVRAALA
jgi:DNA-directed RNA polymerase specialized sigma24 family protein